MAELEQELEIARPQAGTMVSRKSNAVWRENQLRSGYSVLSTSTKSGCVKIQHTKAEMPLALLRVGLMKLDGQPLHYCHFIGKYKDFVEFMENDFGVLFPQLIQGAIER